MPRQWTSCCFNVHAEFLQYVVFAFFNLLAVLFCMAQLYGNHDCNVTNVYMPLLTMIIGSLIPTPSFTSNKSNANGHEDEDGEDENFTESPMI